MVTYDSCVENYEKLSHLSSVCRDIGSVWVASHKPSNLQVAVKIYNLDKCGDELELIQHEIRTVRQLRHRNILEYLATFTASQQLWVVMPLMGYTSAAHLVASGCPGGLPEPALMLIMRDVLHGLQYLHSKGIIHRAIKGSHIQIASNGRCTLSGLRHSTTVISQGRWQHAIHDYPPEATYILNWASPELLEQDMYGYSEKSDIYSLGIVVCELGNGEVPYSDIKSTFMLVQKCDGRVPFLLDSNTYAHYVDDIQGLATDSGVGGSVGNNLTHLFVAKRCFSPAAHHFVDTTLSRHPENRPSANDLLHHTFIKQAKKLRMTLPQILSTVLPRAENVEADESLADLLEGDIDQLSITEDVSWEF